MIAPLLFWAHPLAALLVSDRNAAGLAPLLLILGGIYGMFSLAGAAYWTAVGIGEPGINARWAVAGKPFDVRALGPSGCSFWSARGGLGEQRISSGSYD